MPSPESPTDAVARPDDALMQRLRSGDGDAFVEAARPHQAALLRLAGRFVATVEDAEDVVQEAVVEGFRQVRRFRGEASIGTWLGRIVIRKAVRASKRRRPSREVDASEAGSDEAERIAVRNAVARLPAKLRAPVVLRFYEGLDGNEIAELLDRKPSTVWTRLYRGLKRLREDLGEEALP